MNLFSVIFLTYFSIQIGANDIQKAESSRDIRVIYLDPGEMYHFSTEYSRLKFYQSQSQLRIYCYRGAPKSISRYFQRILLLLDVDNDDYTQYEGSTPEMVQDNYDKHASKFFHFFTFSNKKTQLSLNPFNQTCIGIDSLEEYRIKLEVSYFDFWKIGLLTIGILMYCNAARLIHNALFYYLSGMFLGISASLIVVVYLITKLLPRRPVMYGAILCGWSLVAYILRTLFENIQVIFFTYQTYVLWYILLTGFISFVICYRLGPPKDQRSKDLIKWGLQLASLIMIFCSSEFQEASFGVAVLTAILNFYPYSWLQKVKSFYARCYPPKPRFLTEDEFYEQGVLETSKALDELREYVKSPKCEQWKIISKLRDPLKFATFVEGSPHVSDDEINEHNISLSEANISDSGSSDEGENNTAKHEDSSEDENYNSKKVNQTLSAQQNNGEVGVHSVTRRRNNRVIYFPSRYRE